MLYACKLPWTASCWGLPCTSVSLFQHCEQQHTLFIVSLHAHNRVINPQHHVFANGLQSWWLSTGIGKPAHALLRQFKAGCPNTSRQAHKTKLHTAQPVPAWFCLDDCVKCSSLACLFSYLCSISINPSISPWRQQLSSHMLATYRLNASWQSLHLYTQTFLNVHKQITEHMLLPP